MIAPQPTQRRRRSRRPSVKDCQSSHPHCRSLPESSRHSQTKIISSTSIRSPTAPDRRRASSRWGSDSWAPQWGGHGRSSQKQDARGSFPPPPGHGSDGRSRSPSASAVLPRHVHPPGLRVSHRRRIPASAFAAGARSRHTPPDRFTLDAAAGIRSVPIGGTDWGSSAARESPRRQVPQRSRRKSASLPSAPGDARGTRRCPPLREPRREDPTASRRSWDHSRPHHSRASSDLITPNPCATVAFPDRCLRTKRLGGDVT